MCSESVIKHVILNVLQLFTGLITWVNGLKKNKKNQKLKPLKYMSILYATLYAQINSRWLQTLSAFNTIRESINGTAIFTRSVNWMNPKMLHLPHF